MNILVIGSGAREHALVWKLTQSPLCKKIYCAPGNPGIARLAECIPIKSTDISLLKDFAWNNKIDLTVVGPEQPLVNGIVDAFEALGLKIFGPSKRASRLEGSKAFAKGFMQRHNIPTAEFQVFTNAEIEQAKNYIDTCDYPLVIKADGLAAGKGVTICHSKIETRIALKGCFEEKVFQDAGSTIVIEEFMEGEEASIFAITDGTYFVTLSSAQDHKRALEDNKGSNTGGMGAYAPAPIITEHVLTAVTNTIIKPTLEGMKSEGNPYKGCLYVGLMITRTGPKVVEYNCRFGDPETQVILPLLEDDLAELMLDVAKGDLKRSSVKLKPQSSVCIVLASGGYPGNYATGKEIKGISNAERQQNIMVFHAGTSRQDNVIVTSGGRVLGVTAVGDTLKDTITQAYSAVASIQFEDMHFRRDIGRKGIQNLKHD